VRLTCSNRPNEIIISFTITPFALLLRYMHLVQNRCVQRINTCWNISIWLDNNEGVSRLSKLVQDSIFVIASRAVVTSDRMFLKMQGFNFAQILSILTKFFPNIIKFAQILSLLLKFRLNFPQILLNSNQTCLNLINFFQIYLILTNKIFSRGYGCIPSSYGTRY